MQVTSWRHDSCVVLPDLNSYQVLTPEQQLQARAVLYGQCVGDALGLLTEFLTKKEAKQVSSSCVMKQESDAIQGIKISHVCKQSTKETAKLLSFFSYMTESS